MNALRLIAVAAVSAFAVAAQTAHADQTLTRAKVGAELAQAKANRQVTIGELDYPPVVASAGVAPSRSQVVAELGQARVAGLSSMGELDYPPSIIGADATATQAQVPADLTRDQAAGVAGSGEEDYSVVASRPSSQSERQNTSDVYSPGLVVNLNGNRVWTF